MNAQPSQINGARDAGAWKVVFEGDPRTGPKTIGSIILDLNVEGDSVTGRARVGSWPGEAPVVDAHFENGHLIFLATGHLDSTTGIPTCKLDVVVVGDEMHLSLTMIRNAAFGDRAYRYSGTRVPDYASAKLTDLPRVY